MPEHILAVEACVEQVAKSGKAPYRRFRKTIGAWDPSIPNYISKI